MLRHLKGQWVLFGGTYPYNNQLGYQEIYGFKYSYLILIYFEQTYMTHK